MHVTEEGRAGIGWQESLKRCIREAQRRQQLVAFIVLDNPQESLLDMKVGQGERGRQMRGMGTGRIKLKVLFGA